MKCSPVTAHWLFKATLSELKHYAALVKEGKSLDEGLRFASFVLNSGLGKLLDEHPADFPLPCDGRLIFKQAENLRKAIWLRWETRDNAPHVETSDLESIREDIRTLKIALGVEKPVLRVVKGGKRG